MMVSDYSFKGSRCGGRAINCCSGSVSEYSGASVVSMKVKPANELFTT